VQERLAQLADSLITYLGERIDEFGRQRTPGIGSAVTSKRPYDALLVIEPTAS